MSKKFWQRNKPIFAVGFLAAIAFIVVIVMSQKTKSGLTLTEVAADFFDNEKPEVIFNPDNSVVGSNNYLVSDVVSETTESTLSTGIAEAAVSKDQSTSSILEINFTSDGFSPNSANIVQWQVVRWTNKTDKDIVIRERIKKYKEFADGITVPVGKYFDFQLYSPKLWTFEEVGSGKTGRLYIAEKK